MRFDLNKTGAACLGMACIAALQLGTGASVSNPPVTSAHSIEQRLVPSLQVRAILRRACIDCHSNETRWPWYTALAPVSWLISHDVNNGRKELNFSEWTEVAGSHPGTALGALMAACADVQSGRMPLKGYQLLHRDARLTRAEKDAFCQWTRQSAQRYRKSAVLALQH